MTTQPAIDLVAQLHKLQAAVPYVVSLPAIVAAVYYILLGVASARRERASLDAWRKR